MSHPALRTSRRFGSTLGVAVAIAVAVLMTANLPVGAQPETRGPSTCPMLDLANPNPGDRLSAGEYVVSGVTFDPVTQSVSGVSHIDFFLGPRDEGGMIVGSVVPSEAPAAENPRAFETTLTLPNVDRGGMLVAYAYSGVSPATTILSIPIEIGSPPKSEESTSGATPTPVPASITIKSGCPTAGLTPSGVAVTASTAPVVAVNPAQGPTLLLGNPNAEDVLLRGAYLVSGAAFDPASPQGPGVDHVDFFLGAREEGGLHLGSATPGLAGGQLGAFVARLSIPTNASGGHTFVAYAHSAVTGLESVVSVPVFVGVAPVAATHP